MLSMLEIKRFYSKARIRKSQGKWRVSIMCDPFGCNEFASFEEAAAFHKKVWTKCPN